MSRTSSIVHKPLNMTFPLGTEKLIRPSVFIVDNFKQVQTLRARTLMYLLNTSILSLPNAVCKVEEVIALKAAVVDNKRCFLSSLLY